MECAEIGLEIPEAPEDEFEEDGDVLGEGTGDLDNLMGIGPVMIWNGSYSGLVDPEENSTTDPLLLVVGVGSIIWDEGPFGYWIRWRMDGGVKSGFILRNRCSNYKNYERYLSYVLGIINRLKR